MRFFKIKEVLYCYLYNNDDKRLAINFLFSALAVTFFMFIMDALNIQQTIRWIIAELLFTGIYFIIIYSYEPTKRLLSWAYKKV